MEIVLVLLGILALVGAGTAGAQAFSPGLRTGRRVELGVLAGALAVAAVLLALLLSWIWQFERSFSF